MTLYSSIRIVMTLYLSNYSCETDAFSAKAKEERAGWLADFRISKVSNPQKVANFVLASLSPTEESIDRAGSALLH